MFKPKRGMPKIISVGGECWEGRWGSLETTTVVSGEAGRGEAEVGSIIYVFIYLMLI